MRECVRDPHAYGTTRQEPAGRQTIGQGKRHGRTVDRGTDSAATSSPTPLGNAITHYGRIAKTLHIYAWPTSPATPNLPGGLRRLRNPHSTDEE
ncbi:hypothetical protein T261_7923 [Streptomyces lydicus]|nr:hypothetical protein T261_7923 [Streptomyces lydicus]